MAAKDSRIHVSSSFESPRFVLVAHTLQDVARKARELTDAGNFHLAAQYARMSTYLAKRLSHDPRDPLN